MSEASPVDAPAPPRRRYLTILFSDLSDSTRISSRLEAEDYSDLLARLREIYHRVIAEHGGVVSQISGDGMLAVFGHPEPREDDGRRAVEAALELHAAAEGLDLKLHSGIHAGLVLLHAGDEVRGRFELLGTATNIASRLCGLAEAGQILVSEATLGPERHLFETSERSHLVLKGKDEPVATLVVHGLVGARRRYESSVRGGLTPFIGRDAEWRRLQGALAEAMEGRPRFLEIEGPAGVGKTRLADELLRDAGGRGALIHRGECDVAAAPLQPFLQIVRSIFGLSRPMPPEEAAQLVENQLAQIDPALLEHRKALLQLLSLGRDETLGPVGGEALSTALRALFERLTTQNPLVLLLDDWHLADDASREAMSGLGGLAGAIFVLATARPREIGDAGIADFEILPLAPFSDDETAEAIARLIPAPDPFVIAKIGKSSGGNALYIEELCHSIVDGRLGEGPHGGSPWIDILVESRLSRLPAPQSALVRQAAVIGTIVPAWLLEEMTGHSESDPLIASLAKQDFIFPGEREGTLRFKHGLTRDAVYDSVGLGERRALHRKAAEALLAHSRDYAEEEPHEALAYHFGGAADDAATARHAELAGDRALAASALDRAQAQYRAALDALDRLPASDETGYRWGRIAQRFGLAGVFDPSRDQLPVFERAIELARRRGDLAALAWGEYWLGYINYALGESVEAIGHLERALDAALQVNDDPLAVQIRATLGQTKAGASDYAAALPLLDQAIAVKRRHRTGARPPIGFAYSIACKGFALGDMGRFAEAHECYEEALGAIAGARDEVTASILTQRSAVSLWQGAWEDALRFAAEAERAAERARSHYCYNMARTLGGYARWRLEGDPAMLQVIDEAASRLEESRRGQFTSLNYGWLAEIAVAMGKVREARHYAARAIRRARKRDRLGEAMAWRALARASAAEGWPRLPDHYVARALQAAAVRSSPHEAAAARLCEGEIALAAGDQARAEAALAEAIQGFAALDMDRHLQQVSALARTAGILPRR